MCSPQHRIHCYCVSECRLAANVFPTAQNTLLLCGSVILHNRHREERRSATFDFEIQFVCEKFRSVKNTNIDINRGECTEVFVWK